MADGVRIMAVDPRLRGAVIEVPHPTRFLGSGAAKLYRILLDGEGAALVSVVVWQRIQEIMAIDPTAPRFIEVGVTSAPPTQMLNGATEDRRVLRHRTGHGIERTLGQVPVIKLK